MPFGTARMYIWSSFVWELRFEVLTQTQKVGAGAAVEKRTLPATSGTERDVRSVQHACNGQGAGLPPDLGELARVWPDISETIRTTILSLARDAATTPQY